MATITLTISALPAHVRTARLMAATVARRAGIAASAIDEIRLAVGEACSRAVAAHKLHCPTQPILLQLIDGSGPDPVSDPRTDTTSRTLSANGSATRRFEVVVSDSAPAKDAEETANPVEPLLDGLFLDGEDTPPGGISGFSPGLGLAVITGLADEVSIEPNDTGTVVRMSWPLQADQTQNPSSN
ncbi:anti-sigma regulatory factor [Nocardiopsis terrae]|uniref:Anti-sigma regulatory factor (Ser/Thr protein kinase) n=1 Tax=Nocardiopsis terrae TaxID=372655 RepID=A0ABR9HPM0_9ACTN|nr:ATP-binding protein [Nocardiopsis terrae]MBE1460972.1 anti-sigma regulatory factor (Ser/Thr protein kinase) [Nocardiopsis terrae]GHC97405.1 anti-sigma regulatory factor [Nocardiopsis terrae]